MIVASFKMLLALATLQNQIIQSRLSVPRKIAYFCVIHANHSIRTGRLRLGGGPLRDFGLTVHSVGWWKDKSDEENKTKKSYLNEDEEAAKYL